VYALDNYNQPPVAMSSALVPASSSSSTSASAGGLVDTLTLFRSMQTKRMEFEKAETQALFLHIQHLHTKWIHMNSLLKRSNLEHMCEACKIERRRAVFMSCLHEVCDGCAGRDYQSLIACPVCSKHGIVAKIDQPLPNNLAARTPQQLILAPTFSNSNQS
jgi:hypothetical protein